MLEFKVEAEPVHSFKRVVVLRVDLNGTVTAAADFCLVSHVLVVRCLTPELSRTAARNGGVVHVTMQPSREAVSA